MYILLFVEYEMVLIVIVVLKVIVGLILNKGWDLVVDKL